jgi:CheY-like chemotaxis protein
MYKVLVVDDIEDARNTIKADLDNAGYSVMTADNPENALDIFIRSQFDFAVVDVRLCGGSDDDISGLTLSMAFKQLRPEVGIILLTRYVPSDLTKRAMRYFGILGFINKVKNFNDAILKVLEDAQRQIEDKSRTDQKDPDTYLLISIQDRKPIYIHSRGLYIFSDTAKTPFLMNAKHVRRANALLKDGGDDWRAAAKDLGDDLWNTIFVAFEEVMRTFSEARTKSQQLSISIETSREGLGLPFEFTWLRNPEEYLALQYPVTRFITGISPKRGPISPSLLALTESLNVLIIASNTLPDIPGVDRETQTLYNFLMSKEIQDFIPVHVEVVPTEKASVDNIRKIISNPKYDIIHYAGHGSYDSDSPENSCLFFWEKENKKGTIYRMKAVEIADLLSYSKVRLLYLSCCFSTASGIGNVPNDDFLGLGDAIIQKAGVPSVLGFRAPVSDNGAVALAESFYKHLFERGRLDISLWLARRELARIDRNNPSWLSPILISQD